MTELLIRATALLLGALVIARLLRHSSPLSRHALWATTTLALLALPMLQSSLPRLGIPGWTAAAAPMELAASEPVTIPFEAVASTGLPPTIREQVASAPSLVSPAVRRSPLPVRSLLLIFWLLGSLAVGASILLGMRRARRLTDNAIPVTSRRLLARFDWARRLTRVTRPVALRTAPGIRSPMTGGLLHPVVLLPEGADTWDDAMLDSVLRHELIHVRRFDAFHQVASRWSVAFYWFHPLAWRAARHGALAREQACDAAVLALGTRPSHYARQLLALAEQGIDAPLLPAFARLHHPTLEDRLMSILESPSTPASSRRTVLALAGLAAWAVVVASAGPVNAQAAPPVPVPPPAPAAARAPMPAPHAIGHVATAPSAPTAMHAAPHPAPHAVPSPPSSATAPTALMHDGVHPLPAPAPTAPAHAPVHSAAPMAPQPHSRVGGFIENPAPPVAAMADCELGASGGTVRATAGARAPVRMTTRNLEGRPICMAIRGALPANTTLVPMPKLPNGVVIALAARGNSGLQQFVIAGTASGNQQAWHVNGKSQTVDRDALAWRDAMLEVMAERDERSAVRSVAPTAEVRARYAADRARAAAEVSQATARVVERDAVASARARYDVEAAQANVRATSRLVERDAAATARARYTVDAERRAAEVAVVESRVAETRARAAEIREAQTLVERSADQQGAERAQLRVRTEELARARDQIAERASVVAATRAEYGARVARSQAEADRAVALVERRRDAPAPLTPAGERLKALIERIGGR